MYPKFQLRLYGHFGYMVNFSRTKPWTLYPKAGVDHFHWPSKSGFFKFPLVDMKLDAPMLFSVGLSKYEGTAIVAFWQRMHLFSILNCGGGPWAVHVFSISSDRNSLSTPAPRCGLLILYLRVLGAIVSLCKFYVCSTESRERHFFKGIISEPPPTSSPSSE